MFWISGPEIGTVGECDREDRVVDAKGSDVFSEKEIIYIYKIELS